MKTTGDAVSNDADRDDSGAAPTKRVLSSKPPAKNGEAEASEPGASRDSASEATEPKKAGGFLVSFLVVAAVAGVALLVWRGPTLFAHGPDNESAGTLDASFVVTSSVTAPDASVVPAATPDESKDGGDDAAVAVVAADDLGDLDDGGAADDDVDSGAVAAMTPASAAPHQPTVQKPTSKPRPTGKPKPKPPKKKPR